MNETGQQYNLKWTSHTNNILQMFAEQLSKENLVDCTLSCEGQFIKAHKIVLSACSPYFQELFQIHPTPHPVIIMNGVAIRIMKQVIEFMYRGEIKVGDCDLETLLMTAETLQIKGLCKVRKEKSPSEAREAEKSVEDLPTGIKRKRESISSSPEISTNGEVDHESDIEAQIPVHQTPVKITKEDKKTIKIVDRKRNIKPATKNQNCQRNKKCTYPVAEDKTIDQYGLKIPRPPNAFMIFANEWRKKLAVEHTGENNKEISVRLGNMWKSLPAPTKDSYYVAAKKADEEHKVKYPGYYYSPKEARLRKEFKSTAALRKNVNEKGLQAMQLVKLVMPDCNNEESSSQLNEGNRSTDGIREESEEVSIDPEQKNPHLLRKKQTVD